MIATVQNITRQRWPLCLGESWIFLCMDLLFSFLKNFSSCHGCGVAENFITCWLILVCSCSLSAAHFWIQLDLMLVSYESLCRFLNRILNQMKVWCDASLVISCLTQMLKFHGEIGFKPEFDTDLYAFEKINILEHAHRFKININTVTDLYAFEFYIDLW